MKRVDPGHARLSVTRAQGLALALRLLRLVLSAYLRGRDGRVFFDIDLALAEDVRLGAGQRP